MGCGTLTLYDRRGERLATVQYARMPEAKKETLAAQLQAEAHAILGARPDLRRVYLADGAESNWDLLAAVDQAVGSNPLKSVQIVDFYPIGSGVGDAACKTLVTQRLKGSGLAWPMAGGQAILTLRSPADGAGHRLGCCSRRILLPGDDSYNNTEAPLR